MDPATTPRGPRGTKKNMYHRPWISGPKEHLEHAVGHLSGATSFDYRIAMISIDNAVELAIKTYLQLPKRVRGTEGPSRKQFDEKSRSFQDVLDLLEQLSDILPINNVPPR